MTTHKLSNRKSILIIITVLSINFIAGCKKEMVDNIDDIKYVSDKNILVFKSMDVLKKQIDAGFEDNGKVVAEIAARFPGFSSMKKVFDKFDMEEAALVEKLPGGTNVDWSNYLRLSDIGKQYSNMILVKQFPDNREYYYDMNIRQRHFADFVNSEGLLAVNDSIYQFSEKFVKIITDGDYSKIALLGSLNATDSNRHIIVFDSRLFVLGYFKTVATAACFNVWDKSNTGTSNNKRISLVVSFEQNPDGIFNKTTCTAGIGILKKKVVGIWFNATARSIRLRGAFSGPRSPYNNITNVSGYHKPNPFDINYSSPVNHYTDMYYQADPCYTMTSGTYIIDADFQGGGVSTTVSW